MGFTHFDENGKAVMVDVTDKKETVREACASGRITVSREVSGPYVKEHAI